MTTTMNSDLKLDPVSYSSEIEGVPVDSLDLRGAILSPGLALSEDSDRRLVLHTLTGGRASKLGTFDNAADAWRALDELDAVDELDLAA
jgi:hypothetical protein